MAGKVIHLQPVLCNLEFIKPQSICGLSFRDSSVITKLVGSEMTCIKVGK